MMSLDEVSAVALTATDVPSAALAVFHCEDCACAVSSEQTTRRKVSELPSEALIATPEILELPLDEENRLLFNQSGHGGVIVVNEPAHQILRQFETPRRAADVVTGDRGRAVVARLLECCVIHERGRPPQPEFRQGTELTAWLHVTNACNLRCPYCYIHKSSEPMEEPIARAAVDALLRSAVANGFRSLRLKYAGGEASLNSGVLVALHDYAVEQAAHASIKLSTVLLSNGTAIPDPLAAALKVRDIKLMISLDGVGAVHDAQRPTTSGRPSFHMVERTVERLARYEIAPHISVTITSRNVRSIADVVRFALERNLTFSFNFFRDNDCAASFADLQYEERDMITGVLEAFAVVEELLPRWSILGSVLDRGQLVQPRQRSCGVGDDYVVIDQRGRIAKCHMELGTTIGNIRTVDPVQAVRRDTTGIQNLLAEQKEGCRTCRWRNWCSGGCAVATFRATGRFDVQSPNCNIYQAIYPAALKLEGKRLLRFATIG
jgi:uncharacterized protein